MRSTRSHTDDAAHGYVDPAKELNAGLWTLFAGASAFLALRLWIKVTRRHGLWYDDYILIVSWFILAANNSIISVEYATGYVADTWDDRMHILINITSCGTLVGQALTKTAFGVTLLKLSKVGWQKWILWFCIGSMNLYMVLKILFQWAKVCEKKSYQNWYRLDFCIGWTFRNEFKEGGNVYNIIMDFIFALYPWIITWKLDMRRAEKVGLCVTMSLGMVVAIVSAVRTGWKDEDNGKDELYFWRNAMSNIWYSSEIVGTIIVQCIPVMRPLLRDLRTSLTSKRLTSGDRTHETNEPGTRLASKHFKENWDTGTTNSNYSVGCWAQHDALEKGDGGGFGKKGHESYQMDEIPEEEIEIDTFGKITRKSFD